MVDGEPLLPAMLRDAVVDRAHFPRTRSYAWGALTNLLHPHDLAAHVLASHGTTLLRVACEEVRPLLIAPLFVGTYCSRDRRVRFRTSEGAGGEGDPEGFARCVTEDTDWKDTPRDTPRDSPRDPPRDRRNYRRNA